MLRQGVSWDPGQGDAALAGRLAARQPDRERLRDPLRVLLEGLEERSDLVEEDRLRRKLRLQLRVTSKHVAILRPEPRFVSPEIVRQAWGSQDGYHRADDESDIEQAAEHQPPGPQSPRSPEREVDEPSRSQGEHHGKEVKQREVPRGEQDAESNGHGALEHHRAGNVAEGQGILAVPHPEDGVELFGQLGRQWREDEGYQAGGQPKARGGMLDRVDEEVRARDDDPEARERLEDDGEERRVLASRQEQKLL